MVSLDRNGALLYYLEKVSLPNLRRRVILFRESLCNGIISNILSVPINRKNLSVFGIKLYHLQNDIHTGK